MIAVKHLDGAKVTQNAIIKKKNQLQNSEKHMSVPSLSQHLRSRMAPPTLMAHSKSSDYIKCNKEYRNKDKNKDKLQLIEVYQSVEGTTYHSLVQLNPKSYDDRLSIDKTPIKHIPTSPSDLNLPQSHHTHTATPRPYKHSRVRATSSSPINISNYANHINATTHRKNQIPFISEELSTHSHSVNSVSSYPSILALKLSFTNQASTDDMLLTPPAHKPNNTKNNVSSTNFSGENDGACADEDDDNDVISSDSSFYDNAFEEKNNDDDDDDVVDNKIKKITIKPIIIKTKGSGTMNAMNKETSMEKLKLKPDYVTKQTTKTTLLSTPQLTSHLLSATDVSSLLDHADTYDPPHSPTVISRTSQTTNTNTHSTHSKVIRKSNQYKIQPMLQSVVEEVSDQDIIHNQNLNLNLNLKKRKKHNKNIRYTKQNNHYQRRHQEFDKIINKKQTKHKNSLGVNVNININNNNNNSNIPVPIFDTKKKKKNKLIRKKPNIIKLKKRNPDYRNRNRNKNKPQSSSLVITAKKRSNVDIRRPHTSRELANNNKLNLTNANKNIINMNPSRGRASRRLFRLQLGGANSESTSADSDYSTITITSSISTTTRSTRSDTISTLGISRIGKLIDTRNCNMVYNANEIRRSTSINYPPVYRHRNLTVADRRPVRIIRRNGNGHNMVRATSAMNCNDHVRVQRSRKLQKYGLFDDDSSTLSKKHVQKQLHVHKVKQKQFRYRCESKKNELLSEWESLERDKLFLNSRYKPKKACDGVSDLSKKCDNDVLKRLSVRNNQDHKLCKKEVHDAYERGFLAGYFLGVNIMQQQLKDHDNKSVTK